MSIEAVARVMRESKSRLGARLVMICLANHDAELGCFVSLERVAKESNMSVRQVQRCITELERIGELAIDHQSGPNGTNRYTFLLPQPLPHMGHDKMSKDKMSKDNTGPGMSPKQNQTPGVEVVPTAETSVLPTLAPTARAVDPIFELMFALETGLAYAPENSHVLTARARGSLNAAVAEIRATRITPEDLAQAVAAWPTTFPGATATAWAVAKHLPRLSAAARGLTARRRESDFDETMAEVARRRQAG